MELLKYLLRVYKRYIKVVCWFVLESIEILRLIYVSFKVNNIVNSSKYIKHKNNIQSS